MPFSPQKSGKKKSNVFEKSLETEAIHDFMDSLPECYLEADKEGCILFANKALCRIFNDVKGRFFWDLVSAVEKEEVKKFFKRLNRGGSFAPVLKFGSDTEDNATTSWFEARFTKLQKNREVPVWGVCIRNISEQINIISNLEAEQERFRSLTDNLNVGYYRSEAAEDGKLVLINDALMRMFGYKSRSSLLRKKVASLYVSADQRAEVRRQILTKGYIRNKEVILRKKGGDTFTATLSALLIRDKNGEPLFFDGFIHDISETRIILNAINASEQKYRNLIDTFFDIILITDYRGKILFRNQSLFKQTGWSIRDYQTAFPGSDMIHPEDRERFDLQVQKVIRSRNKYSNPIEFRFRNKNGEWLWFSAIIVKMVFEEQRSLQLIIRNVTREKKFGEELKERELQYKTLFELSPAGIVLESPDGTILDVNPAFCHMMGYTRNELIGKNVRILAPHQDQKLVGENIRKIMSAEVLRHVVRNYTKDGREIHLELHERKFLLPGGVYGIISMANDITDRVKAQEALQESEKKYRMLVEYQNDLVVKIDPTGKFLFVSPSYCKTFGKSESELLGKKFMPLVHKDDREHTAKMMERLYRRPWSCYLEQRAKTARGWRWFAWVDTAIRNEKGEVVEIIGVGRDITRQKEAEQSLKISEKSYKGLFNNATDAIYIQDKQGRFLDVNRGAVKMYGYPRSRFIGQSPDFLSAPGKNDMNKVKTWLRKAFEGKPQRFEFWGIDSKGRVFPKEVRMNRGYYFGQEVVVVFAQDITERYEAQRRLIEQEKLYRQIFNAFPDIYFRSDPEGIVKVISPSVEKLTGYKIEEVIGKNSKDFYASKEEWKTVGHLILQKKGVKDQTVRIRKKSGKILYCSITARLIPGTNGNPPEIEGVLRDITDRYLAEREIRKLSRVVEQSPTIIMITDLKARIEYVNATFTKITGYTFQEVAGKNPKILKSGKTPETVYMHMWNNLIQGKEWTGEFINRKKSGEIYNERAHLFPLKDEKGKVTHYIGLKEDITLQKEMEQELISAKERAVESDRLKSAFLANMSHEIRTPMNAIIGFSQLLDDPDLDESDRNHFIQLIQNSGNDLMHLIDDIIDISRIETGEMRIFKNSHLVDPVMRALRDEYAHFLRSKPEKQNLKIEYQHPVKEAGYQVFTDIDRFKQVMRNLLSNAVKFTEKGKITIGFTPEIRNGQKVLRFYVCDTGIGIPEEQQEKIFESFVQIRPSKSKLYGGTGLGLAITKKIIHLLDGDIWVESKPGKGSTFHFTLPIIDNLPGSDIPGRGKSTDKAEVPALNNVSVVVVDDDPASRELIRSALKKSGASVYVCSSGPEGIEAVRSVIPDIVLLDIRMAGMDGFETLKQIREEFPDLPVIAQTAHAFSEERDKCLKAGFNDYISKPLKLKELFAKIRALV
ncbi:MAG: hypothetical protein Kow00127_06430 [Bacteroidales bacterium]